MANKTERIKGFFVTSRGLPRFALLLRIMHVEHTGRRKQTKFHNNRIPRSADHCLDPWSCRNNEDIQSYTLRPFLSWRRCNSCLLFRYQKVSKLIEGGGESCAYCLFSHHFLSEISWALLNRMHQFTNKNVKSELKPFGAILQVRENMQCVVAAVFKLKNLHISICKTQRISSSFRILSQPALK